MHDDRTGGVTRERELRREGTALLVPRRVVVVVIQAAFPHRNRAGPNQLGNRLRVAKRIERGGVMRMDAGRESDETGMARGDLARPAGGVERFTDANDTDRPGLPGAVDDLIAVGVERRIREVRVAIEERGR
jgi:hypothetical protein